MKEQKKIKSTFLSLSTYFSGSVYEIANILGLNNEFNGIEFFSAQYFTT